MGTLTDWGIIALGLIVAFSIYKLLSNYLRRVSEQEEAYKLAVEKIKRVNIEQEEARLLERFNRDKKADSAVERNSRGGGIYQTPVNWGDSTVKGNGGALITNENGEFWVGSPGDYPTILGEEYPYWKESISNPNYTPEEIETIIYQDQFDGAGHGGSFGGGGASGSWSSDDNSSSSYSDSSLDSSSSDSSSSDSGSSD